MISVLILTSEEERGFVLADVMELGTVGCVEEEQGLRAFFADETEVERLSRRYRIADIRQEAELTVTTDNSPVEPILAGERFFIVQKNCDQPTPQGRLRLEIDAGSAFGTGRHETTQLILGELERVLRPGMTVADVGCGSGILSKAALLLGAARVVACDIDPVFLNAIPDELRDCVFVGSADGIASQTADIVLANITPKVLDRIAYDVNRIARPDGVLVLSGFVSEDVPSQFTPERESALGDWICWICKPSPVRAEGPPATEHSLQWY